MLPIPSQSAFLAFVGATTMAAVALVGSSPLCAVLAGSALVALAGALMLTMPLGARLRAERLEFAWWQGHAEDAISGGAFRDAPIELRCYIRNRSDGPLRFAALLPIAPAGVEILSGAGAEILLPPRTRTEFAFTIRVCAAGRAVLQGLSVSVPGPLALFHAPLYFPSPLAVKVLPRAAHSAPLDLVAGGQQVERAGFRPLRRRGGGTELHEIREHRPGDPFKAIAWRPSARAGKLMVREVENEVQETVNLVLDISGSMRGGLPGNRKLDHGIELCAILARQALEQGDRVGLLTVDGRIVDHIAAAEGRAHLLRLYEALLRATEIVDEDLTEIDDEALVPLVSRYLRHQEGRDFGRERNVDIAAMVRHVHRALPAGSDLNPVLASSPDHAVLRRFCRLRGISLPYRADTRAFAKGHGLAAALREAAGATRMPRTVLCITDLDGITQMEPLIKTLAMLRARHHTVAFLFPDAESLTQEAAADRELERTLRRVFVDDERRRFAWATRTLTPLGVSVLPFGAGDNKVSVARRINALHRVA